MPLVQKVNQCIEAGDNSHNYQAHGNITVIHQSQSHSVVDNAIKDAVGRLRKARFFHEFGHVQEAVNLGECLLHGDLVGGSPVTIGEALAWCSRLASTGDDLRKAPEFLTRAKTLGTASDVVTIAEAFLIVNEVRTPEQNQARKDELKGKALRMLEALDSSSARSAALFIVAQLYGAQGALDWLHNAGYTAADLDPDGKIRLILALFEREEWDVACNVVNALTDDDFDAAPYLFFLAAMAHLLIAVPSELKTLVLRQIPFDCANFRLADDVRGMQAREVARNHFDTVAKAAPGLGCPKTATDSKLYALWLQLKDPATAHEAKRSLEDQLRGEMCEAALNYVPLGVQFGVLQHFDHIEKMLTQYEARYGGMQQVTAAARLAIALSKKTPDAVIKSILQRRDALLQWYPRTSIDGLLIDMYSQAGRPDRATQYLEALVQDGISSEEQTRLQLLIDDSRGEDTLPASIALYKRSGALADLKNVVDALEKAGQWSELHDYAEKLFFKTRALADAERLAWSLYKSRRYGDLFDWLESNSQMREQSPTLRTQYCWALYREGKLLAAQEALNKLPYDATNPSHRALRRDLGLALGDVDALGMALAECYTHRASLPAAELINAAQLAAQLDAPRAKDLVLAATKRGADDPDILMTAFVMAAAAGWENEPQVGEWIRTAAALSKDNGPLRRMPLSDFLEAKAGWDQRDAHYATLLRQGDLPLCMASEYLNHPFFVLTFFPALANMDEKDPRRRQGVPAYSGQRHAASIVGRKTIGVDVTALMTLALLDVLEPFFNYFETVSIPHTTLGWLLHEQQRAAPHQRSQLKHAEVISNLLAKGALKTLAPGATQQDPSLANIDKALAALLVTVQHDATSAGGQHFVVCSGPVHTVSSLMPEEADLSAYQSVLVDCQAVVAALHAHGDITRPTMEKAQAYLQPNEVRWPNQPSIAKGATLYLDSLAVGYLAQAGLLQALAASGFTCFVHPEVDEKAKALLAYGEYADRVNNLAKRIHDTVTKNIEAGKITFGRLPEVWNDVESDGGDAGDGLWKSHPSVACLQLAQQCDGVIMDDRVLNQGMRAEFGDNSVPLYTTLDVLDALCAAGRITKDERLEHRTTLRRAGYVFIPMEKEELRHHVEHAGVANSAVVESAELRAIRENILLARMRPWLRLPKENPWLHGMFMTHLQVILELWTSGDDVEKVRAQSAWLLGQLDARHWAHCYDGSVDGSTACQVHVLLLGALMVPPEGLPKERLDAYLNWIEAAVLAPLKEAEPEFFEHLMERCKEFVAAFIKEHAHEDEA